jgi:hypothetical protein
MPKQSAENLHPSEGEVIAVRTRKPAGAVLSVRVPRELVIALDDFVTEHQVSMSDVVREAVEFYMSAAHAYRTVPTLYASINTFANVVLSSPEAQLQRPTHGEAQTETRPRQGDLVLAG